MLGKFSRVLRRAKFWNKAGSHRRMESYGFSGIRNITNLRKELTIPTNPTFGKLFQKLYGTMLRSRKIWNEYSWGNAYRERALTSWKRMPTSGKVGTDKLDSSLPLVSSGNSIKFPRLIIHLGESTVRTPCPDEKKLSEYVQSALIAARNVLLLGSLGVAPIFPLLFILGDLGLK